MQTAGPDRLVGAPLLPAFRIVFIFIASVEVLAGTVGNGLLLLFLGTRRSLCSRGALVHNLFIASLAVTDLLALGYWMVFFVLDLSLGYNPVVNEEHCVVNGFLITVSATCMLVYRLQPMMYSLILLSPGQYLVPGRHILQPIPVCMSQASLPEVLHHPSHLPLVSPVLGSWTSHLSSAIFRPRLLLLHSQEAHLLVLYWANVRLTSLNRARVKEKDNDNEDDNEVSEVCQTEARNENKSRTKEKENESREDGNDSRNQMVDEDERGNRTNIDSKDVVPKKVQCVNIISLALCQGECSHEDDRQKGHGENREDRTSLYEAPEAENRGKVKDCRFDVCHRTRSRSFADSTQDFEDCTHERSQDGWLMPDHVTDELGFGEGIERSSECSKKGDKEEAISTSQFRVFQSRRQSSRNMQTEEDRRPAWSRLTSKTSTDESCVTSLHRHHRRQRSREVAFVRSLCVVCFLFFVGFFPYTVINVVDFYWTVPPEVLIFSNLLLFFNSAVNWIVYGVMNPTYRRGYAELVRGCLKRVARETGTGSGAATNLPSTSTPPKKYASHMSDVNHT
ncbi:hypothetical protein C0Q70_04891 [Pomacea canaliculata]|uniref:G-protein coupled receptors family 1 profile domain-containing protein n=1 Tax=Pomacea canaliculata TaxID=400727 RepID=A0A2T7PJN9_POMCA|nr:hypothetical protein C0Q70_04891 [Pomacea canaliculata]